MTDVITDIFRDDTEMTVCHVAYDYRQHDFIYLNGSQLHTMTKYSRL